MTELAKVQRRITLRVACAYHTTSTDALQIVASIPPLDLQAQVRKSNYERRGEWELNLDPISAEDKMLGSWQERWNMSSKGRWTHRLIPNIHSWFKRKHGHTDFWITQVLTGHGCFDDYLHKYKKIPTTECWFCGHANDTTEYTIYECDACEIRRQRTNTLLDMEQTPESMIPLMLESKTKWETFAKFNMYAESEK